LIGEAHRQHLREMRIDEFVSRHKNLLPETTKPLQKSSGLCAKSGLILGFFYSLNAQAHRKNNRRAAQRNEG